VVVVVERGAVVAVGFVVVRWSWRSGWRIPEEAGFGARRVESADSNGCGSEQNAAPVLSAI
jgi:hypothetical protein